MVRKKVYKREFILNAAFEVVSKEGFQAFTARNIAKHMGISTQPIYLEFENMVDLKCQLLTAIHTTLEQQYFSKRITDDVIIDLGLNYIEFALQEPQLYYALFVAENQHGRETYELSYRIFKDKIVGSPYQELTETSLERLHNGVWIIIAGFAGLMSSGVIHPTQEQLITQLRETIHYLQEHPNPQSLLGKD